MKKSIFFVTIFIILNGCAQFTAVLGPTFTMAKTGSLVQTSATMATSYGVKKKTGKSPGEHLNSLVKESFEVNSSLTQKENVKECQIIHTSSLNKIFFATLDEIDCFEKTEVAGPTKEEAKAEAPKKIEVKAEAPMKEKTKQKQLRLV